MEKVLKGRKGPRPMCQSSKCIQKFTLNCYYARVSGLKAIKVSGSIVVKKQNFFYCVNSLCIADKPFRSNVVVPCEELCLNAIDE